jgi:Fungal Zn(2)-Cys(6) binuclear cluster domain
MSAASTRKPTRLRAACNECHAVKLRCSGERSGCQRCAANGLTCVYEVSMVGRAPKTKKRRRIDEGPTNNSPEGQSIENGGSTDAEGHSTEYPTAALQQPLLSDLNFGTNGQDTAPDQSDECNCDTLFARTSHPPAERALDLASLGLPADFDVNLEMPLFDELLSEAATLQSTSSIEKPLSHSPATDTSRCPIAMIDPLPERPNCTDPNHDKYRHVMHMVRVVAVLESKNAEERLVLDEVLQFNKACLRTVMMVFEMENRKFCKTCKALAPTAIDLVMALYEKAVKDGCGESPVPSLGCFELEKDDHCVLRDLIVQRELQRTIQTVQTLCEWSRCTDYGQQCGIQKCYNNIENRLRKLMPPISLDGLDVFK